MTPALEQLFEHVREAAERLEGQANRTPVMTSRTLDARVGAHVFLKCENFQRVGAFKFRGAFNAISKLDPEQRARGVLTYSSGNHAQAVALVGRLLSVETVVVMPDNAPSIKRAATEAYGARVVEYDPEQTTRERVAASLQAEHGYILIPPYDHLDIVAGQGTVALEFFDQVGELDQLVVPCGGGGLLSGSAIVAKSRRPECRVIGIEPALADDATRSFRSGVLHTVQNPPTIADGARTPSLGEVTFPLVLEYVDDMQTVTEEAIASAVCFLFFRLKLVVEPAGALGVAALLERVIRPEGRVGVVLSGGNIDGPTMRSLLG